MAALAESQRTEVWADVMRWLSDQGVPVSLTKAEVAEVVNRLDDGIADSLGMIDAFLGPDLAAGFDAATKNHIFSMVVQRRIEEGV